MIFVLQFLIFYYLFWIIIPFKKLLFLHSSNLEYNLSATKKDGISKCRLLLLDNWNLLYSGDTEGGVPGAFLFNYFAGYLYVFSNIVWKLAVGFWSRFIAHKMPGCHTLSSTSMNNKAATFGLLEHSSNLPFLSDWTLESWDRCLFLFFCACAGREAEKAGCN